MSKRLQVILDDAEYRDLVRVARRHRVTVSEWVRRALRELSLREPAASPDLKLAVVREAARGDYPTADIGVMLRDIEAGYLGGPA
jgi:transposase-like protein